MKKVSLGLKQAFCFPVIKEERACEKRDKFYSLISSRVLLTPPREMVFGLRQFCVQSKGHWCFRILLEMSLPSSREMASKARGNVPKGGKEPCLGWLDNTQKFFFLDLGNEA